jgi:hypothetical protein
VLMGALPLILAALAKARHRSRLRLLVGLPVLAVLVFIALTGVLVLAAHFSSSHRPTTVGGVSFIAWGLAGLACGAICVVASRRVLFAVPMSRWRLVTAFASGMLVTAAMVTMTMATGIYAIALAIDASPIAGAPNGPLQAMSVSASLVEGVVVMAIAAALAATTTRRGWRAARELSSGPGTASL